MPCNVKHSAQIEGRPYRPAPSAYCSDFSRIRAIVLGADPTAFDKDMNPIFLEKVFGIGGEDKRYFASILKNLNAIELGLEGIFVQNLVRDYQENETSNNPAWLATAALWVPILQMELDALDPKRRVPVLVTGEIIMHALLLGVKPAAAKELYSGKAETPAPETNGLGRQLIPMYRHHRYSLVKNEDYSKKVKTLLPTLNS